MIRTSFPGKRTTTAQAAMLETTLLQRATPAGELCAVYIEYCHLDYGSTRVFLSLIPSTTFHASAILFVVFARLLFHRDSFQKLF